MNADSSALNGNADAEFRNCVFFRANIGVTVKGRNVRCSNCIFSTLHVGYKPVQTALDTDNRGYIVNANRFHSTDICIQNEVNNTRTPKNFIVSENFADMCGILFYGYGGGVVIDNNTITTEGDGSQNSIIVINKDALNSGTVLNVIKNNNIIGRGYTGSNTGILVNGAKVIIIDNTIQRTGGPGIGGGVDSYVIAKNNYMVDVAQNTTNAINFPAGADGVIKNNTIYNSAHSAISAPDMAVADNEVLTP